MFEIILLFIIIVIIVYKQWKNRDILKLYNQIGSGVMALPIIGHSYLFLGGSENRMRALQTLGRDAIARKGISGFWHANKLFAVVADPAAAEVVLKTCLEKDDIVKLARLLTGNGSVFAEVSIWRPRRKTIVPHLSIKNLNSFMKIFTKQSNILVDQLRCAQKSGVFSLWTYLSSYTMDAVCEAALGVEINAQRNPDQPFLKSFDENVRLGTDRIVQPWLHNAFLYKMLPAYTTYMKNKSIMYDFMDKIIKSKRNDLKDDFNNLAECDKYIESDDMKTLLTLLLLNRDEKSFTDLELQEELMVLVLAGTDTSAAGIAFTFIMLSRHQDVQQKVYEELQEVFGDTDRPVDIQDLSRLKYLDAVFRESLRLYPPVPVIVRKVEKEVVLPSGITLVPGCGVLVNIWASHRNPEYWGDDAEKFRPERFLDTPLKHPAAFLAFSNGPRGCIGYQFAMRSAKTVLASLLRHYRILPPSPHSDLIDKDAPLRLKFDVMMKDVDNFRVQLQARS